MAPLPFPFPMLAKLLLFDFDLEFDLELLLKALGLMPGPNLRSGTLPKLLTRFMLLIFPRVRVRQLTLTREVVTAVCASARSR
jgi:hypothetical protein